MERLWFISFSVLLGLMAAGWESRVQAGENYPAKPITLIVPLEAGADGDTVIRPIVQKASKIIGKPMVVVNKPGGGQTIGYREIYAAKPDGYTIGLGVTSIAITKLVGLFPHDHHDFTPVCLVVTSHPIISSSTRTQRPFKTIEEVISFARANPGEVSMATTAIGGIHWITAMVVQEAFGVRFNMIPQEGSGGFVVSQVAGGHQDLGIAGFSSAKAQIDAGNVRFLAVVGGQRFPGKYNYAPMLKELGYDVSINSFSAIIGPPGLPKDIVVKLMKTFETACDDPEIQGHIEARNFIPLFLPPQKLIEFCDKEKEINRRILSKAGLLKEK